MLLLLSVSERLDHLREIESYLATGPDAGNHAPGGPPVHGPSGDAERVGDSMGINEIIRFQIRIRLATGRGTMSHIEHAAPEDAPEGQGRTFPDLRRPEVGAAIRDAIDYALEDRCPVNRNS
jgi:hypothetical protein